MKKMKSIKTEHGILKTPFFMPDATRGFVKLISNSELKKIGVGPMVVNTLHLYLQPGTDLIKKAGGLHKFMNWDKPLLSDSGGFQVFSLIHRNKGMGKVYDDRVEFKSPLDGSRHILTPEKSIQIQFDLGVDMMVALDECPPNNFTRKQMEASLERTIEWAKRSKAEFNRLVETQNFASAKKENFASAKKKKVRPLLFGVIQGGMDLELRKYCAEELIKIGFDGYGFGASPVDGAGKFRLDVLEAVAKMIPEDKLRFALGIGTPKDIIACAHAGWDMFDCVIPTREGRHGKLFNYRDAKSCVCANREKFRISGFKIKEINILNAKFKTDFSIINKNSKIPDLSGHTLAYLHHLFKNQELLGQKLASLHNLEFYMNLLDIFKKNNP